MPEYYSPHRIGDEVTFRPNRNYQRMNGRIVTIRITEHKLRYDIRSTYYGRVYKRVDSFNVLPPGGIH